MGGYFSNQACFHHKGTETTEELRGFGAEGAERTKDWTGLGGAAPKLPNAANCGTPAGSCELLGWKKALPLPNPYFKLVRRRFADISYLFFDIESHGFHNFKDLVGVSLSGL